MKKKLSFILLTLLFTSCVNIASPVNYVTVIKVQGSKSAMTGSQLEDIAKGLDQEAGDIKGVPGL